MAALALALFTLVGGLPTLTVSHYTVDGNRLGGAGVTETHAERLYEKLSLCS